MIKLPEKKWFLFSELMQRWQCAELDIVRLLLEGQLVPCYHFSGDYGAYQVNVGGDGDPSHSYLDEVSEVLKGNTIDQLFQHSEGFYYLMQPKVKNSTEGEFHFFSALRKCLDSGDRCFHIPTPLSVSEVIDKGVVMAVEVVAFEESYGKSDQSEKPLVKRERDTLLAIIAVVCREAKLDFNTHAKTAGLIKNMAFNMDISIGESTIEGHLKKIPEALEARKK